MVPSRIFAFLVHVWPSLALHVRHNGSVEKVTCSNTRVFNIGLPRTGTESFCKYGRFLGYSANHQAFGHSITPAALHSCVQDFSKCTTILPTEDPEKPDMFCDHPLSGIGCQLARAFPEAKFVLMKRSFNEYFASARYWMCIWGRPDVCPGKNERDVTLSLSAHIDMYGEAYKQFCDQTENETNFEVLCGGRDYGSAEEEAWNDFGLTDLVKRMWSDHDDTAQKCIPADRLLVLDLENPNKAEHLGHFLGCSGTMPEYPHAHWVSGKEA